MPSQHHTHGSCAGSGMARRQGAAPSQTGYFADQGHTAAEPEPWIEKVGAGPHPTNRNAALRVPSCECAESEARRGKRAALSCLWGGNAALCRPTVLHPSRWAGFPSRPLTRRAAHPPGFVEPSGARQPRPSRTVPNPPARRLCAPSKTRNQNRTSRRNDHRDRGGWSVGGSTLSTQNATVQRRKQGTTRRPPSFPVPACLPPPELVPSTKQGAAAGAAGASPSFPAAPSLVGTSIPFPPAFPSLRQPLFEGRGDETEKKKKKRKVKTKKRRQRPRGRDLRGFRAIGQRQDLPAHWLRRTRRNAALPTHCTHCHSPNNRPPGPGRAFSAYRRSGFWNRFGSLAPTPNLPTPTRRPVNLPPTLPSDSSYNTTTGFPFNRSPTALRRRNAALHRIALPTLRQHQSGRCTGFRVV